MAVFEYVVELRGELSHSWLVKHEQFCQHDCHRHVNVELHRKHFRPSFSQVSRIKKARIQGLVVKLCLEAGQKQPLGRHLLKVARGRQVLQLIEPLFFLQQEFLDGLQRMLFQIN